MAKEGVQVIENRFHRDCVFLDEVLAGYGDVGSDQRGPVRLGVAVAEAAIVDEESFYISLMDEAYRASKYVASHRAVLDVATTDRG